MIIKYSVHHLKLMFMDHLEQSNCVVEASIYKPTQTNIKTPQLRADCGTSVLLYVRPYAQMRPSN